MTGSHRGLRWKAPNQRFYGDVLSESSVALEPENRPKTVTVAGKCPYCLGESTFVQILRLVPSLPDAVIGQAAGKKQLTVAVTCRCPLRHRGRPDDEEGCGQTWVITVEF